MRSQPNGDEAKQESHDSPSAGSNNIWSAGSRLPHADIMKRLLPSSDFDDTVRRYLEQPIEIKGKGGKSLYVYVLAIDAPSKDTEGFVRFSFRVRTSPDLNYAGPKQAGERTQRRAARGTVFEYVFHNASTLEQNEKKLKQFVLRQCAP